MAPKGCTIQHDLPYDPVRPLKHHRGIVNPSIAANHQVERRRLRDWEVGGRRALQDSVHVGGHASIPVGATWTICQETAGVGKLAHSGHRRQAVPNRLVVCLST